MAASGEEEEDRLQREHEEMMASGADYVEYDLNEILDEAEGEGEDNDGDDDDEQEEEEDDSVLQFRGHKDSVYCVSVHPSRPWALSGDGDDSFCVWSLEDASVIYHEQAHADTIIAASFNFDGEYFATASMDGIVKVWATEDGKLKHTLEGPSDDLEWMQWHPKGNVVACGGADTTVWIYDTMKGECLNVLAGHEDSVLCGDFTPSGKQIVTSGADGWTKLWSPKSGKCTQTLSVQEWHSGPIVSQSCAYSRPLVATGSIDSTMKIANLQTNKCLSTVRFASTNSAGVVETSEDENAPSVESVAFAPNVNWIAGGANNGKVIIFDLDDGSVRHSVQLEESVTILKWHPTLPLLIVAAADSQMHVIDARSGDISAVFKGHSGMILDVAILPSNGNDGKDVAIITAGDDKTCRVFQL